MAHDPRQGVKLKGKRAFIAGIGDDQGYGWAIAKALASEGCELVVGTWVPLLNIFTTSFDNGKFDASRALESGGKLSFAKVYGLDAMFDRPEEVPQEIQENKRYKALKGYTISEVAAQVASDFGTIDFLVHSLANAPEVKKPLLDTSRSGYLAALSASSYSFISLIQHFGPLMPHGSALSLSYIASERAIPGYGGGMSSAKAALESDTRMLAYEAGRRWNLRVNVISAGPLGSRAAKAIGFIDKMIAYSYANAPLKDKALKAEEIGKAARFLLSSEASAITGVTLYVDNGLHAMGLAVDSSTLVS